MHEWKEDEKCIFHVDVNSAFLSWSALKKLKDEPGSVDLRTIPSAVGGDVQTRHGVVTAKSIPAKRFGVKTGEPVAQALRKCPSLVLVKSDFKVYREYSHAFISILREYSDLVEQVSIDEAFLDMTNSRYVSFAGDDEELPWPLNVAHRIRERVHRELGFTVNVGISVNKLLAKMASDFEKPDKVHTLYPEEIPSKMWPLGVGELHGCGEATSQRLKKYGILTIGQAAALSMSVLQTNLGQKTGEYIWKSANGISSSTVRPTREKAKSYSNEETTAHDITRENYSSEGVEIVRRLSRKVASRMEKGGVFAQTIGVNVKTDDFRRHSRQVTLYSATRDAEVIFRNACRLMEELLTDSGGLFDEGRGVRLIGVGCSGLSDGSYQQMDLFAWAGGAKEREEAHRKKEKLEAMMAKVRSRYGQEAISKGAMSKGAMSKGAMSKGAMSKGAISKGAMSKGAISKGAISKGSSGKESTGKDTIS